MKFCPHCNGINDDKESICLSCNRYFQKGIQELNPIIPQSHASLILNLIGFTVIILGFIIGIINGVATTYSPGNFNWLLMIGTWVIYSLIGVPYIVLSVVFDKLNQIFIKE